MLESCKAGMEQIGSRSKSFNASQTSQRHQAWRPM